MLNLKPRINAEYPKNNKIIFEEWFAEHYDGCDTDRELLPFFPTAVWVNNNYGNDMEVRRQVQDWVNQLDRKKKYFVVVQYDDGVLVDWGGLDVLEFNMSKNTGIGLPLLCQPKPVSFTGGKKWFCNFIGSKTHPVRDELEYLKQYKDYYVSYDPHDLNTYCRILHESIYTLCPRGYGINSFRIAEAIEFGSIPVWISDEFINPYGIPFSNFGVEIRSSDVHRVDEILQSISLSDVIEMQNALPELYKQYYSFRGAYLRIIEALEAESDNR